MTRSVCRIRRKTAANAIASLQLQEVRRRSRDEITMNVAAAIATIR
jgi:hypothetical protein